MAASAQQQSTDPGSTDEDAKRWIAELDGSEKWQLPYLERCRKIVRRYKEERTDNVSQQPRRFAILWSNTQTLGPAVYARTPQAVVTRRYRDSDPTGRYASEVLERALSFSMDQYDFDDRIKQSRDDYLLLARGQIWVRYVPHMAEQEPGEDEGEQVTQEVESDPQYAEVLCDHVNYADWGMQPCRSWDETGFVWRRVYLNRQELTERFGKKLGKQIPLDWKPEDNGPTDSKLKKAAIYEIWDKATKQVFWISKTWPKVLDQKADWLKLDNFYPCPRPLMGTLGQDNYIPVPDYVFYQDQAEELDELTQKIGDLTDALGMRGVYAGEMSDKLANVFGGKTNELFPIDSMAGLQDKGGLSKVIEWFPVDQTIETLKGCFETRQKILEDIYQITGISDIVRGASDPNETATAQGIKAQWGSLRVRDRQKELARFARDVLRIKAEIIARNFPLSTLQAMTDVQLLTNEQKQQLATYQQLAQQNQALAQQPPPGMPPNAQQMMSLPSWEDVEALLKNDALRSFRVDVETDSTIEPDENEEKQRRVEFVTALATFIGEAAPLVQSYPPIGPLIGETVKFLARGFRVGREMEDVIENVFEQIKQSPPAPPAQDQKQPQGPSQDEVALKQQELQQKAQSDAASAQNEQQRNQIDMQLGMGDLKLRQGDQQLKAIALQRDPRPQAVS